MKRSVVTRRDVPARRSCAQMSSCDCFRQSFRWIRTSSGRDPRGKHGPRSWRRGSGCHASRSGASRFERLAALTLGGGTRADELESEKRQAAETGDEKNDHG